MEGTSCHQGISILIPTYNRECLELVSELQAQCSALDGLELEVIVADDGSTDRRSVERNRAINHLPGCRYLERTENVGRARIRNALAREARFDWLLYIDSGMRVRNPQFMACYYDLLRRSTLPSDGRLVFYGGYTVAYAQEANPDEQLDYNLRYRYESKAHQNSDASLRAQHPYRDFHTSNFMVTRVTMLRYPLDERFVRYGYEDVLWGDTLEQAGVPIKHVDNPVSFERCESNLVFISKTDEALCTLYQFRHELARCSRLVTLAERLRRARVVYPLVEAVYPLLSLHMKARLMGGKSGLALFGVYKLMYYIHLDFQHG